MKGELSDIYLFTDRPKPFACLAIPKKQVYLSFKNPFDTDKYIPVNLVIYPTCGPLTFLNCNLNGWRIIVLSLNIPFEL